MAFEPSKFLESPDLEVFDQLKKDDLVSLARHIKVDFKLSMRKQTIKNKLIDALVDKIDYLIS